MSQCNLLNRTFSAWRFSSFHTDLSNKIIYRLNDIEVYWFYLLLVMKTTAIHCMEMTAKQEHYDFKMGLCNKHWRFVCWESTVETEMKNGTTERMKAFNRNKASHKHRLSCVWMCAHAWRRSLEKLLYLSFLRPTEQQESSAKTEKWCSTPTLFLLTGKANRQHISDKNMVKLTKEFN